MFTDGVFASVLELSMVQPCHNMVRDVALAEGNLSVMYVGWPTERRRLRTRLWSMKN